MTTDYETLLLHRERAGGLRAEASAFRRAGRSLRRRQRKRARTRGRASITPAAAA